MFLLGTPVLSQNEARSSEWNFGEIFLEKNKGHMERIQQIRVQTTQKQVKCTIIWLYPNPFKWSLIKYDSQNFSEITQ